MPSNDLFLENIPRRRLNACDSDPSPIWESPTASSTLVQLSTAATITTAATSIIPTPPMSGDIVDVDNGGHHHSRHHHHPRLSHSASSSFPDYMNFLPGFPASPPPNHDDDDEDYDDVDEEGNPQHRRRHHRGGDRRSLLRLIPDSIASHAPSTICLLLRDFRLFDSHEYQLRLSSIVASSSSSSSRDFRNSGGEAPLPSPQHVVNPPIVLPCRYQNSYALTADVPAHVPPGRRLAEVIDVDGGGDLPSDPPVIASASLTVDSVTESLSRLVESSSNPLSALADALGLDVSDNATLDRHLCKLFRQNTPYEPFDRALRLGSSSMTSTSVAVGAARETTRKYPSLLHLAAAYGLKDLCANMIDCPGVEALQRMTNVDGATPRDLASAAGFHELAAFLDDYQRQKEVVEAARITMYKKITQAVGLYDKTYDKTYYMCMSPSQQDDDNAAAAAGGKPPCGQCGRIADDVAASAAASVALAPGYDLHYCGGPSFSNDDAAPVSATVDAGNASVDGAAATVDDATADSLPAAVKPGQEESFESVFGSETTDVSAVDDAAAGLDDVRLQPMAAAACCIPTSSADVSAENGSSPLSSTPHDAMMIATTTMTTPATAKMEAVETEQPRHAGSAVSVPSPIENRTDRSIVASSSTDFDEAALTKSFSYQNEARSGGSDWGLSMDFPANNSSYNNNNKNNRGAAEESIGSPGRAETRPRSEDLGYVTMSSSRPDDHSPLLQLPQTQHRNSLCSYNRRSYCAGAKDQIYKTNQQQRERHSIHETSSDIKSVNDKNNNKNNNSNNDLEVDFSNEYMKMSKVDASSTPCLISAEAIKLEAGDTLFGISPSKSIHQSLPADPAHPVVSTVNGGGETDPAGIAIPRSPSMNSTHSIPDPFPGLGPGLVSNFGRGAFQSKEVNLVRQWETSLKDAEAGVSETGSPPTTTFVDKKKHLDAFSASSAAQQGEDIQRKSWGKILGDRFWGKKSSSSTNSSKSSKSQRPKDSRQKSESSESSSTSPPTLVDRASSPIHPPANQSPLVATASAGGGGGAARNNNSRPSTQKKTEKKRKDGNALTRCSNPRTESLTSDASEDGDHRRAVSRHNNNNNTDNNCNSNNGNNNSSNHSNNGNSIKGDYYHEGETPRRNSINAKLPHKLAKHVSSSSSSASPKQYSTAFKSAGGNLSSSYSSSAKYGRASQAIIPSQPSKTPAVYYNHEAARNDRSRSDGPRSDNRLPSSKSGQKDGTKPRSRRESENQQQKQQQQQQQQKQQQQHHPPLKETSSWKSFEDQSPPAPRHAQSTCPRPQSAHAVAFTSSSSSSSSKVTATTTPTTPAGFAASASSSMGRERFSSSSEQGPDLTAIRRQRVYSLHNPPSCPRYHSPAAGAAGAAGTAKSGGEVTSLPCSLRSEVASSSSSTAAASDVPPPIPPRAQRPNSSTPKSASASTTPTAKTAHRQPPPLPSTSSTVAVTTTTSTAAATAREKSDSPASNSGKAASPRIQHSRLSSGSPASDYDQSNAQWQQPKQQQKSHEQQQQHTQQSHERAPHSRSRGRPVKADFYSEVTVVRPASNVASASSSSTTTLYPEINVMSTGHSARLSSLSTGAGRDSSARSPPETPLQHPLIKVRDHFLQESMMRAGGGDSSLQS